MVGADVVEVEVAPAYDHADIAALAAAHVASELICLFRHRAGASCASRRTQCRCRFNEFVIRIEWGLLRATPQSEGSTTQRRGSRSNERDRSDDARIFPPSYALRYPVAPIA